MTRPESLQWCGFDLRAQGSQSAKDQREHFLTLGCSMLRNVDHFQRGRAIWSRDDLLQQLVEARNGRLSIFGELECGISPWFQPFPSDMLVVAKALNLF